MANTVSSEIKPLCRLDLTRIRLSPIETPSPISDGHSATARYLRLTVLGADLPVAQAELKTVLETDYADRVSVVEFKVFQSTAMTVPAP